MALTCQLANKPINRKSKNMKYTIISDGGKNSHHIPTTAKSGNHLKQVWHLVVLRNGVPACVGYLKKHFNSWTGTANNPVVIELKLGNRFACGKASGCGYVNNA